MAVLSKEIVLANIIKIKNSGTSSNTPSSLEHGELAINYADGKIFYKNQSNTIVEFSSGGASVSGTEVRDALIKSIMEV